MDINLSTKQDGTAVLLLNGQDVSKHVTAVTVRVAADDPQLRAVTLELRQIDLEVDVAEGQVQVEQQHVDALRAAGVQL